ncbi:MAG: PP2C family protein-serine/threonine phosphatase [Verrucomicrobiota bacterium]
MLEETRSFTGITRRRWTGLVLIWLTIFILFGFLYVNARRSVLNEIRHQVMGVAIAVAAAVSPADLEQVQTPEDRRSEAFHRVQDFISRVEASNPDVRYIYTMRRTPRDDARDSDYEFVVDAAPRDLNGNGAIDSDEASEPPGKPYDASKLPALIQAWYRPGADKDVSPDPPYPDLMSGYAPVKNDRGQTVAIVGVDITAATVRSKLLTLQGVILLVWFVLSLLITLVAHLYYQQQEALERIKALSNEVSHRNEMLRAANAQLARHNEQFRRELRLAQTVQLGFLPKTFPRRDKVSFDKYYLSCEMLGGDLYDVFNLDDDHVGMYVADVAGHGVSAALISGLLKMAVVSVREHHAAGGGELLARMNQPELVLATLNDMIIKEIPDYEFITMIYAVLDIARYTMTIACAGHPPPVVYNPRTAQAERWEVANGIALGLVPGSAYECVQRQVVPGEKIVLYTDGLTEAMNKENEEFGEQRLLELLKTSGPLSPTEIVAAMKQALEQHRKGCGISDDFSVLVAEIR